MANIYKLTVSFADVNGASFSETHHITASNAKSAAVPGNGVFTARVALLHPLYTLQRVRASNVDGSRDTANVPYNKVGTYSADASGIQPSPASLAVVWTIPGQSGGSRRWWVRGVSDTAWNRDAATGRDKVAGLFQGAMDTFLAKAAAAGMGIYKLTPTPRTPTNFIPLIGIARDVTGRYTTLTLQNNPGWADGQRVIIYGTNPKDLPSLNGGWQIIKAVGTAITINYVLPADAGEPTISGTIRRASYDNLSVYNAADAGLHHIGEHDTKSPLFGSRGARRVKRLRTSL